MSETVADLTSPSILNSIKKLLGIDASYDVFDVDIMMHINSTFFTLNQLGVGPASGFTIQSDAEKWSDYLGVNDNNLNAVKSYMYLKVRMLFDPPSTSFAIDAMKKQAEEYEWRLNVHVDPPPISSELS